MRTNVAIALLPILVDFTVDERALLLAGVQMTPVLPQFQKYSDRIPELVAVCGFLTKDATITLPPIPA